jgi:hypothetical protein
VVLISFVLRIDDEVLEADHEVVSQIGAAYCAVAFTIVGQMLVRRVTKIRFGVITCAHCPAHGSCKTRSRCVD